MTLSPDKLQTALTLADETLSGITLETLNTASSALRCLHLARLLGDTASEDWLGWECFGYPRDPKGFIQAPAFAVACTHGREMPRNDEGSRTMFSELASELESSAAAHKDAIPVVTTSGVSVATEYAGLALSGLSAAATANADNHIKMMNLAQRKLGILRAQYYSYASKVSSELRFSARAEEVFRSYREEVDRKFLSLAPESVRRLDAAYERLSSSNPESWSQAVSSCRRVFEEIANAIYTGPPDKYVTQSGKELSVTGDKYKNRLFATIDANTKSKSARKFIGANATYVIELIDHLHTLLNRGVHEIDDPLSYEEARSVLIHTYVLLGDLATLPPKDS